MNVLLLQGSKARNPSLFARERDTDTLIKPWYRNFFSKINQSQNRAATKLTVVVLQTKFQWMIKIGTSYQ